MMKRILILLLSLLMLTGLASAVELPEELTDAVPKQAKTLLRDADFDPGGDLLPRLKEITVKAAGQARSIVRQRARGAVSVLLAVVLCSMAEGFYQGVDDQKLTAFLPMVGALSVTLLTTESLGDLMGLGTSTIHELNLFSKALLPTLAAATAASGGVASASARQVFTVFFVDLFLNLVDGLLIPLVYLYVGALAASACLPGGRLGTIAEILKKVIVWILTGVLILFTLYLSISGIFTGVVDSSSVRVAKATISGAVPVVGGIIAEASETILAGASLLRGSIGLFGVLAIFAVCAVPFLQLGIQYLLYKLTAFLAAAVGSPGLCKLIDGLGGAFGLLLGMTGSCALLLLISVLASVSVVVT